MKKKLLLLPLLIIALACTLVSCGHEHTWAEATCTEARRCTECDETEGSPLGHDYKAATCTEAKTCTRCAATDGEPLAHTYVEATCTAPKTCSVCNQSWGGTLAHSYDRGVCTACESLEFLATSDQLYTISEISEELDQLHTLCNTLAESYRRAWYFYIYEADDYYSYDAALSAFSSYTCLNSTYVNEAVINYLRSLGLETTKGYGLAVFKTLDGALAAAKGAVEMMDVPALCSELMLSTADKLETLHPKVIGEDLLVAMGELCNAVYNYYFFVSSPSGTYNSFTSSVSNYKSICDRYIQTVLNELEAFE